MVSDILHIKRCAVDGPLPEMPIMALEVFEPTVTLKGILILPVPMSRPRLHACVGYS